MTKTKKISVILAVLFAVISVYLFPAVSGADIIKLKNRNKLEGKITKETDEYIWLEFGGGGFQIWKNEIASIEKKEYEAPVVPQNTKENDTAKVPMAIALILIAAATTGGFLLFFRKKSAPEQQEEEEREPAPAPYDPYAGYQEPKYEPPAPSIDYGEVFEKSSDNDIFSSSDEKREEDADIFAAPDTNVPAEKEIPAKTPQEQPELAKEARPSASLTAPSSGTEKTKPLNKFKRRIRRPFTINILIAAQILTAAALILTVLILAGPVSFGAFSAIPSVCTGKASFILITIAVVFCIIPAFGLFFMRSWARYLMIVILAVLAAAKIMYIATDFDCTAYLFKLATSSKTSISIEKPVESFNAVFGRFSAHRNRHGRESENWQASAPAKTITAFLLLLEFLLLYYFFQREKTFEAFAENTMIPLREALSPKKILVFLALTLLLVIISERAYSMILEKKYGVPDHLSNYPVTIQPEIKSTYDMLKDYKAERVFGFTVHIPKTLERDNTVIMSAFFEDKRASHKRLLSIKLLKKIDYANTIAAVRSRWNPLFIPLRKKITARGIRNRAKLVHARHWSGFYEEITSKNLKSFHCVLAAKNDKLFLDITLSGNPGEIDESTFRTILGSLELPI